MSDLLAPLQGFGDPIDGPTIVNNVHFTLLLPRSELPQWSRPRNVRLTPIPGSNPPIVEEEEISWGRYTVTWRLELESILDLRRLYRMVGTKQTLTLIFGVQSLEGTFIMSGGVAYEALPHTTLFSLANDVLTADGMVEVDATFHRLINPATGLVVP